MRGIVVNQSHLMDVYRNFPPDSALSRGRDCRNLTEFTSAQFHLLANITVQVRYALGSTKTRQNAGGTRTHFGTIMTLFCVKINSSACILDVTNISVLIFSIPRGPLFDTQEENCLIDWLMICGMKELIHISTNYLTLHWTNLAQHLNKILST